MVSCGWWNMDALGVVRQVSAAARRFACLAAASPALWLLLVSVRSSRRSHFAPFLNFARNSSGQLRDLAKVRSLPGLPNRRSIELQLFPSACALDCGIYILLIDTADFHFLPRTLSSKLTCTGSTGAAQPASHRSRPRVLTRLVSCSFPPWSSMLFLSFGEHSFLTTHRSLECDSRQDHPFGLACTGTSGEEGGGGERGMRRGEERV